MNEFTNRLLGVDSRISPITLRPLDMFLKRLQSHFSTAERESVCVKPEGQPAPARGSFLWLVQCVSRQLGGVSGAGAIPSRENKPPPKKSLCDDRDRNRRRWPVSKTEGRGLLDRPVSSTSGMKLETGFHGWTKLERYLQKHKLSARPSTFSGLSCAPAVVAVATRDTTSSGRAAYYETAKPNGTLQLKGDQQIGLL